MENDMWTHNRTVGDIVKDLQLEEDGELDYALPQPWCEEFEKVTGYWPVGMFIWYYDTKFKVFGRPYPLTDNARWALSMYNQRTDSSYPLR